MGRLGYIFGIYLLGYGIAEAAGNYPECVLEEMPGAATDAIAGFVAAECAKRFPALFYGVEPYSWKLKYADGRACAIDKAKTTPSQVAMSSITAACYRLYGTPK